MKMSNNLTKYCDGCGKEIGSFSTLEDYAYKFNSKVFCSWHCLSAYKKSVGANKVADKIMSDIEEHNKNRKILDERLRILSYKNLLK